MRSATSPRMIRPGSDRIASSLKRCSSGCRRTARPIHMTSTMTIVTYRHRPKRPAKPAQVAEIKVPRIVQHTPTRPGVEAEPPDDPEAKARAAAFFAKMGIKRREEGSES